MRIAVIVATLGRRDAAQDLVSDLRRQTRPPDRTIFAVISAQDAPDHDPVIANETLICPKKGSCAQRNLAIDLASRDCDVLVFFDDDFVPDRHYLERLERVFSGEPDIAGVTGLVVADGVSGAGIGRNEALEAIDRHAQAFPEGDPGQAELFGLYGCNMGIRTSALCGRRFDERLPLYGWLEDLDLSNQLMQEGRLLRINCLVGAHRGIKAGRTSGIRLGYSQVANPVYLIRKGTAPKRHMYENIIKYVSVNALKSVRPEPFVDRRGRLRGNLVGLLDILRGRSNPERILDL